jgi:CDP-diacylglycerol--serine O-phosphatidyltransferase
MRLARFNIQTNALTDKRYFIGMPSPAAAGVPAATVYAWPYPLEGPQALAAVAVVIVPAVLMVSTIRFRSFKTINFGWTPSYINIILVAGLIALVATSPRITLLVLAYGYLLSAFIEMAVTRYRTPAETPPPPALPEE